MVKKGKKGDIAWDTMIGWIIAIAVLVLIVILFFVLNGKGTNMIDYIKGLFRAGA